MPGMSNKEKQLEWACRILMTIDVIVIVAGYLSYFQTKQQLISPLIPKSTVYQILSDAGDVIMKISLILAIPFVAGLWFYSFNRKIPAIVLFGLTAFLYKLLFFLF
jgi:hypothetical protein